MSGHHVPLRWHVAGIPAILAIFFSLLLSCTPSDTETKYQSEAGAAARRLRNQQKPNGAWRAMFSHDSLGQQMKKRDDAWVNLHVLHLIHALDESYNLDSTILVGERFLDSVREKGTGFLKAALRPKNYPPEAGLNAFYALYPFRDSDFPNSALSDSLEDYRNKDRLYKSWIRRKGIAGFPGRGNEKNPADLAGNGLVLLYYHQFNPGKADKLFKTVQEAVNQEKLMSVYHDRSPWFLWLLQSELYKAGYAIDLTVQLGNTLDGQKEYTQMAQLIHQLSVDPENRNQWLRKADKLLAEVSADKFALIRNHPMLIYHSDLTAKRPVFVWSQAVPLALWLRLYDDCRIHNR